MAMSYSCHSLRQALLALAGMTALVTAAWSEEQRCASVKAADGSCADPKLVEMASRRAAIVSSQFTSYLGTPLGSVGMPFIPQERLFRDDPALFGLPTNKSVTIDDANNKTTTRSK
jgi:hypothetical protein